MKIEVTQEDIQKGECDSGFYCPIALAMNRVLGDSNSHVGKWVVTRGITSMLLPSEAITFIQAFDAKQPVEPFTFEMDNLT